MLHRALSTHVTSSTYVGVNTYELHNTSTLTTSNEEAFRDDAAEATIAEWLGIDILLDCAHKELLEERNVLTSRLNRGRGELKAEPTK